MNRLGARLAVAYFVLGTIYVVVVAIGIGHSGLDRPIVDPILAVMELITLLAAPLLVIIMAAVHASAAPEAKAYSVSALAFMALAAGLTMSVHFVGLTAQRQVEAGSLTWPSTPYALELLAWDVLVGLALMCAAPVYQGPGFRRTIRMCLAVTGILCLAGTVGPATGNMRLQFIAVVGYGILLPVTALLLAKDFRSAYHLASSWPAA